MSEQVKQRPPEPDWVWQNRVADERRRHWPSKMLEQGQQRDRAIARAAVRAVLDCIERRLVLADAGLTALGLEDADLDRIRKLRGPSRNE